MQNPDPKTLKDTSKFNPFQNFDNDFSEQHIVQKSDHEYHSYSVNDHTFRERWQDKYDEYDEQQSVREEKEGDINNSVTQIKFQTMRSEEEQQQRKKEQYELLINQMPEEPQGAQLEFEMIYQELQPNSSSRESSDYQSSALINKPSHQVNSSSVQQQSPKKGKWRNMYGHSFKHIAKEYLSEKYQHFFNKLYKKHGVTKLKKAKENLKEMLNCTISLSNVRQFLNFDADDRDRNFTSAFHNFYIWYMRKLYMIHILQEKKIVHKCDYIQAKNRIVYLPAIRLKSSSPLEERI